jgi:cell division protein FtsB
MEELHKQIDELKAKNIELEERLKKYTNGDNHKRYY